MSVEIDNLSMDMRNEMACEKCYGTGFVSYSENQSPLGSGMIWNEEIVEFCNCLESDLCPSCGHFWKGKNESYNNYCDDYDTEEISCIFCLWKSTDIPEVNEPHDDYYYITPEEMFKAPPRRKEMEW